MNRNKLLLGVLLSGLFIGNAVYTLADSDRNPQVYKDINEMDYEVAEVISDFDVPMDLAQMEQEQEDKPENQEEEDRQKEDKPDQQKPPEDPDTPDKPENPDTPQPPEDVTPPEDETTPDEDVTPPEEQPQDDDVTPPDDEQNPDDDSEIPGDEGDDGDDISGPGEGGGAGDDIGPPADEVKELTGITVVWAGKDSIPYGTSFPRGAIHVTAHYSTGPEDDEVVSSWDYNADSYHPNQVGSGTLNITYQGMSASETYTILDERIGLADASLTKSVFEYGDKPSKSDLMAWARMAGGGREPLSSDEFSIGNIATSVGTHTLTVSYMGEHKSVTYEIRNYVVGIKVDSWKKANKYRLNNQDKFKRTDVVLVEKMADGSKGSQITDFMYEGIDTKKFKEAGSFTATFKANGYSTTHGYNVLDHYIDGVSSKIKVITITGYVSWDDLWNKWLPDAEFTVTYNDNKTVKHKFSELEEQDGYENLVRDGAWKPFDIPVSDESNVTLYLEVYHHTQRIQVVDYENKSESAPKILDTVYVNQSRTVSLDEFDIEKEKTDKNGKKYVFSEFVSRDGKAVDMYVPLDPHVDDDSGIGIQPIIWYAKYIEAPEDEPEELPVDSTEPEDPDDPGSDTDQTSDGQDQEPDDPGNGQAEGGDPASEDEQGGNAPSGDGQKGDAPKDADRSGSNGNDVQQAEGKQEQTKPEPAAQPKQDDKGGESAGKPEKKDKDKDKADKSDSKDSIDEEKADDKE